MLIHFIMFIVFYKYFITYEKNCIFTKFALYPITDNDYILVNTLINNSSFADHLEAFQPMMVQNKNETTQHNYI